MMKPARYRGRLPLYFLWAPMLALVLLGAVGRLRPVPRIFLFSVLGLPFLLSQAGLYPFGGRLTLFLVPVVLFLSALGLETLDQKWPRQRSLLALGIAIFLILPSATVSAGYFHKPNESRDTKWALGVIEHLSEQGDVLLIDDPNVRQVSFHSRTGDISTIETRRVSSELLMRDYYLSDVEGGLWILSTHRISEAGQMRDLLLESGFLQACSYNAKSTLVVLLELVDSEDQLRKCDITRR